MKIRLTMTGTTPLLMHNVQMASPLNKYAKQSKVISSKRVKTDEDRLEMARIGFTGSLYFDDAVGPVLPSQNVVKSLIEGARLTKAGKKVERGCIALDIASPLIYRGPRTIDEMWADGDSPFVDIRPVSVGQVKVDRCRPIFREWLAEVDLMLDPRVIELDDFTDIAASAGQMIGVGDFRRVYGRYSTAVETL